MQFKINECSQPIHDWQDEQLHRIEARQAETMACRGLLILSRLGMDDVILRICKGELAKIANRIEGIRG